MESPCSPTPASPEAPTASPTAQRVVHLRVLARAVATAVIAGEESRAADLVLTLAGPDLPAPADAVEREVQLRALDLTARALDQFLLAETETSGAWRRFLLPDALGLFETSLLARMAGELRRLGSELLDPVTPPLTAADLEGRPLRDQALTLGRYTLLHDAAGPELDLPALFEALDPRLEPYLEEWLLVTYGHSPLPLVDPDLDRRQRAAIDLVVGRDARRPEASPAGSGQSRSLFQLAYRCDDGLRDHAEQIQGRRMGQLFQRFAPLPTEQPHLRPDAHELGRHEVLVLCPNWHERHVIHRCMSPLTDGLLADGPDAAEAWALRLHLDEGQELPPVPAAWQGRCGDLNYDLRFPLSDLDALARGLAEAEPDLVFHPEITPAHASGWLATRRIGRVQATGYGFPLTSGSPTIDYFVGGAEVEPASAQDAYTEELVLVPGFGASAAPPLEPTVARQRPTDDHQLRLVTTSSRHKLNRALLRAWDAIQDGPEHTCLTLFSNLALGEVETWVPPLSELLTSGEVDLRTATPQQLLVDELVDADLYLDPYPFGGFNTLVEVLCTGCPVVTLESRHARGRFGAALLRRLGLGDLLVARDLDGYVETARRLLADAGLRAEVRARIGDRERVLAAIDDQDAGAHFAAAVRYMRERGPRRRGAPRPGPVLVAAGERPRRLTP